MREETIVSTIYLDSPYEQDTEPYKLLNEKGYWDKQYWETMAINVDLEFCDYPKFKRVQYGLLDPYRFKSVYESDECKINIEINVSSSYGKSKTRCWELNHIEVNGKLIEEEEGHAQYWCATNEITFLVCSIIKSLAQ